MKARAMLGYGAARYHKSPSVVLRNVRMEHLGKGIG